MNALSLIAVLLAGASLLCAVLLTVQVYEHQRYVHTSRRSPPCRWHAPPGVLVCVPCKGIDLDLADNLRSVLSQEYPKYQVRFIVDSARDPACAVIRQVMAKSSVRCELLVAGSCIESGQKVHNLCYAIADLPEEVEVLAFFDSDANPAPDALDWLVDGVCRGRLQAATGYRWFVPRQPSWANLTLASINAAAASLYKRTGWNLLWGGTWAITRELFEHSDIVDAWRGTLSDDLVASRVLRLAGAKVVFEPACMATSPIDFTWKQVASFLYRQFRITRCYALGWWWVAMTLVILQTLTLWGGGLLAGLWAWQGNRSWFWPLLVSTILYALAMLRSHWRQAAWHTHVKGTSGSLEPVVRFDFWAAPWNCVFVTCVMLASALGRSITWRGIHYHIGSAGRIKLLGRVLNVQQCVEIDALSAARLERDEAACRASGADVDPPTHETASPSTLQLGLPAASPLTKRAA